MLRSAVNTASTHSPLVLSSPLGPRSSVRYRRSLGKKVEMSHRLQLVLENCQPSCAQQSDCFVAWMRRPDHGGTQKVCCQDLITSSNATVAAKPPSLGVQHFQQGFAGLLSGSGKCTEILFCPPLVTCRMTWKAGSVRSVIVLAGWRLARLCAYRGAAQFWRLIDCGS